MARKREVHRPPAPPGTVSPHPGAVWLYLPSEADVVYLYDEGHRAALEESAMGEDGPMLWDGGGNDNYEALARTGMVLAFGTSGRSREDGFSGYVYVGPPPRRGLLPARPYNRPQRGRLHLPTGRLQLETYSAVSIGPDDPDEAGAEIRVPPGTYDVSLQQAKPAPAPELGSWPLLYDYLALTPCGAEKPPAAKGKTRAGRRGR
jgi:hypothetical protein